MKTNEFYKRYANTPLEKRYKIISIQKGEELTLNDVYHELIRIEKEIRPNLIRQGELLSLADLVFIIRKDEKD